MIAPRNQPFNEKEIGEALDSLKRDEGDIKWVINHLNAMIEKDMRISLNSLFFAIYRRYIKDNRREQRITYAISELNYLMKDVIGTEVSWAERLEKVINLIKPEGGEDGDTKI